MSRPLRRYLSTFSHPTLTRTLLVESSGCTPCEARDMAWGVLEEMKKADRRLPQDNEWALVRHIDKQLSESLGG